MIVTRDGREWLTTKEAAERLGCSRYTVYALAKRGKLRKCLRDGSRGCWYPAEDVEAVLQPWQS